MSKILGCVLSLIVVPLVLIDVCLSTTIVGGGFWLLAQLFDIHLPLMWGMAWGY